MSRLPPLRPAQGERSAPSWPAPSSAAKLPIPLAEACVRAGGQGGQVATSFLQLPLRPCPGHTSLRSCFETLHGTECSTCAKEGFFAYQQTKLGKTRADSRRHRPPRLRVDRPGEAIAPGLAVDAQPVLEEDRSEPAGHGCHLRPGSHKTRIRPRCRLRLVSEPTPAQRACEVRFHSGGVCVRLGKPETLAVARGKPLAPERPQLCFADLGQFAAMPLNASSCPSFTVRSAVRRITCSTMSISSFCPAWEATLPPYHPPLPT